MKRTIGGNDVEVDLFKTAGLPNIMTVSLHDLAYF